MVVLGEKLKWCLSDRSVWEFFGRPPRKDKQFFNFMFLGGWGKYA